jgi:hypothetical protein
MIEHNMIDPKQLLPLLRSLAVEVAQLPTPLLDEHLFFDAPYAPWTRGLMASMQYVRAVEALLGYEFRNANWLRLIFVSKSVAPE